MYLGWRNRVDAQSGALFVVPLSHFSGLSAVRNCEATYG